MQLKIVNIPDTLSPFLHKEDNVNNFLFVFFDIKLLLRKEDFKERRTSMKGGKFFPLRVKPYF